MEVSIIHNYPNIDMIKTGMLLKYRMEMAGYSVKDIQQFLKLSCPQPVYRWYSGKVLPSVDHLYALSKLLHVHMEELLVDKSINEAIVLENYSNMEQRLFYYWSHINTVA